MNIYLVVSKGGAITGVEEAREKSANWFEAVPDIDATGSFARLYNPYISSKISVSLIKWK